MRPISFLLVGAAIAAAATPVFGQDLARQVTFNRDIAPIVFAHCVSCHRPDDVGPFSLLNYRDARQHATQIERATASRVMPPWKPRRGTAEFIGDRSLSDSEISLIRQWVDQGAVEGSAADLPPAPPVATGWRLGTPDLVVTMPAPYVVPAGGSDVFRTFVIPIPASGTHYVKALEFRPGNARVVHHANLGVDRTRSSRQLDARDREPGYSGSMERDAR